MKKFYSVMFIALGITLLTGCGHEKTANSEHGDNNSNHSAVNHSKTTTEKNSADKDAGNQKNDNKPSTQPTNNQSEKANSNTSSDQHNSSGEGNNNQDNTKSTSPNNVIRKTMQSLNTSVPKMAPTQVPIDENTNLSAAIKSDTNSYNVIFMQTSKPTPINDSSLNDVSSKNKIVEFGGKKYKSFNDAKKEIGDYINTGNNGRLNLGHGIKAGMEGSAGHANIMWNEGNWYINIDTLTENSIAKNQKGLAKNIVNYLENHSLPAPHSEGTITIFYNGNNNTLVKMKWQDNNKVYHLETKKDPMTFIKMATSFQQIN
ncbi:hypothetical protein [Scopulibacillus cellulosilyticus]|uniref:Lipoprotein n=1 Tax=Scopulibacillus cellulosilyticus TaxID=2665665 RepID=A0ABW2Q115_9BACL